MQTKDWAQNVDATENARVAQRKRDASRLLKMGVIHYSCTTYKKQKCYAFFPNYVCMVSSQDGPRWPSMIWWYCMMLWLCLKALSLFFCNRDVSSFAFVTMRVTRTKVAMICMREQNLALYDTMVYARYDSYAAYVTLMCTSNVARQFSMASLDG